MIQALAYQPLAGPELQIPATHVIGHTIPQHLIHGFAGTDLFTPPANHHTQLYFVVELNAFLSQRHLSAIIHQGIVIFCKHYRYRWNGHPALDSMFAVVQPDTCLLYTSPSPRD